MHSQIPDFVRNSIKLSVCLAAPADPVSPSICNSRKAFLYPDRRPLDPAEGKSL